MPCDFDRILDSQLLLRLVAHRHRITGFDLGRRNVHDLAVHFDALMAHELAGLGSCYRKSHAVNNIVETTLEQTQQILASRALKLGCSLVIIAELSLHDAIHTAKFLFFTKL